MKTKILIFISVLSVVLSLLVIPSFADVSSALTGDFQRATVNSSWENRGFTLLTDVYVIRVRDHVSSKYFESFRAYGIKYDPDTYMYEFAVYIGDSHIGTADYTWITYDGWGAIYLDFSSSYVSEKFASLGTSLPSYYPLTISSNIDFTFLPPLDNYSSMSFEYDGIFYNEGSVPYPFSSITLYSDEVVLHTDDGDRTFKYNDSQFVNFNSIQFDGANISSLNFFTCFTPFIGHEAINPDNPDLNDFHFVVDFIVDIFNGIDALIIYDGGNFTVSLLDIILAYLTIYVIRHILKLVAGG